MTARTHKGQRAYMHSQAKKGRAVTNTGKRVTLALTIAAAVLALIVSISPHTTIVANEASTEVLGIDVFGITKNTKNLPEQQFPTH